MKDIIITELTPDMVHIQDNKYIDYLKRHRYTRTSLQKIAKDTIKSIKAGSTYYFVESCDTIIAHYISFGTSKEATPDYWEGLWIIHNIDEIEDVETAYQSLLLLEKLIKEKGPLRNYEDIKREVEEYKRKR